MIIITLIAETKFHLGPFASRVYLHISYFIIHKHNINSLHASLLSRLDIST